MWRIVLDWNLRLSYSSELGAATAYAGHTRSCRIAEHAASVERVRVDELRHRDRLLAMMTARGVRPFLPFEWFFLAVGTTVGLGCRIWGNRASAFGASLFEVNGVSEYRRLQALARRSGDLALAPAFVEMEAQERAHRDLFRELARGAGADLAVVRAIEADLGDHG